MKGLFILVSMLLLCAITVIGCAPAPATPTKPAATPPTPTPSAPAPGASEKPRYGGVFTQVVATSPTNIGDSAISPGPPTFYGVAGESLYYCDRDGNLLPRLATKWEFSPDMKSVTFTLRKGVKFQDGTDFNAEAAKYCLDRGRLGQMPGLKPVTSVDITDDYTVRVNWPKFDFSVWDSLGSLKTPSWMVSPTSIKTHDPDWPRLNVVATGAFKFANYQKDVSITYDRFDGYWQKGLPYLDRVVFSIVANMTTALMGFKAGVSDMIIDIPVTDALDLKKEGRYNVVVTPGNSIYLAPSGKTPGSPFTDIKVRRAVCYALDTKALAEGLGRGYYLPSNQSYPPWNFGYNPDIKGYAYDPAKAKQLLTEAGYPGGFKTKLYFTAGTAEDLFVAIQTYLKAVGIDVELQPQAAINIATMQSKTGWDGLMYGRLLTIVGMDPGALMTSIGFVNRDTYVVSVLRTEDTLALLDQANSEVDLTKRKALLQKMGKLIIDEYCMICPVYYTQTLTALQPYVNDIGLQEFARTYELAWLKK